jgi:hypothetical protein
LASKPIELSMINRISKLKAYVQTILPVMANFKTIAENICNSRISTHAAIMTFFT